MKTVIICGFFLWVTLLDGTNAYPTDNTDDYEKLMAYIFNPHGMLTREPDKKMSANVPVTRKHAAENQKAISPVVTAQSSPPKSRITKISTPPTPQMGSKTSHMYAASTTDKIGSPTSVLPRFTTPPTPHMESNSVHIYSASTRMTAVTPPTPGVVTATSSPARDDKYLKQIRLLLFAIL